MGVFSCFCQVKFERSTISVVHGSLEEFPFLQTIDGGRQGTAGYTEPLPDILDNGSRSPCHLIEYI